MLRTGPAALGLAALLAAVGCADQPWKFRNGVGLGEDPPLQILGEIYEGECGFGCVTPGARVYCAELAAGARGPRPEGLEGGADYCFVGVASDEAGRATAIGCSSGRAGGGPIEVVLSPVDGVARATRCGPALSDAGTRDAGLADAGALDAGGLDAGPRDAGARDAGTFDAGLDAGGSTVVDAGSDVVSLGVYVHPGGSAWVTSLVSGTTWGVPAELPFTVDTFRGRPFRVQSNPDEGYRFDRFEGSCGTVDPCELTVTDFSRVEVYFAPL